MKRKSTRLTATSNINMALPNDLRAKLEMIAIDMGFLKVSDLIRFICGQYINNQEDNESL